MPIERLSWSTVKFTGKDGGPCFIDLGQVAAVTPAKAPGELAALGARVILISGIALYTAESAETVFEEWRRARTMDEPAPPKIKMSEAAPAADVPRDPPAPIAAPEPALMWREITERPGAIGGELVYTVTELWDTKHPLLPAAIANSPSGALRPGHRQYAIGAAAFNRAPLVAKPRP